MDFKLLIVFNNNLLVYKTFNQENVNSLLSRLDYI